MISDIQIVEHGEAPVQQVPVPGFPGYYADRDGIIISTKQKTKIIKPSTSREGHYRAVLCLNGKTHRFFVHHIISSAFVCERPESLILRHLDGNPKNNRPENLKWGTHKENTADMKTHGTALLGEQVHCHKLRSDQIQEIRDDPFSISDISRRYGVSRATIRKIKNRQLWRHIE